MCCITPSTANKQFNWLVSLKSYLQCCMDWSWSPTEHLYFLRNLIWKCNQNGNQAHGSRLIRAIIPWQNVFYTELPWFNCTGWLGIKHPVAHCFTLIQLRNCTGWLDVRHLFTCLLFHPDITTGWLGVRHQFTYVPFVYGHILCASCLWN